MLIEIHILQNHAPSNLNRDDTGSPKSAVFGGVPRARISSQCIKRSIRTSDLFRSVMDERRGDRTRKLPELVRERLLERGFSEELAQIAALKASGFGNRDGKEFKPDPKKPSAPVITAQTMFLTDADIEAVTGVLVTAIEDAKRDAKKVAKLSAKDLQKDERLKDFRPVSIDMSLFGRMITSDAFRDVDATMQVAHALATHRLEEDSDYFTAVDDLQDDRLDEDVGAGADMIGDVEFNSACYYKYFSLDVDGLIANLTGERQRRGDVTESDRAEARELTADVIAAFVRAAALVTPSGKQNTFAANQLPSLILIEIRPTRTPVSYANAFVSPVVRSNKQSLVDGSISRLSEHVDKLTRAFNLETETRLVLEAEGSYFTAPDVERVTDLASLATRLRATVINA